MMSRDSLDSIEVFYSYAQRDAALRDELEKHLGALKRLHLIRDWHHRDIQTGTDWMQAVDVHLNSAHVILLLISSDFMGSDYCYSVEMQRALERHKQGMTRVISVLLRPVDLEGTPIASLRVLPTSGKPITSWSNRDAAFTDVSKGIRQVIQELGAASAKSDQDFTPDFDAHRYPQSFETYSSVIPSSILLKDVNIVSVPGRTDELSNATPVDNPLPDLQSSQGQPAKSTQLLEQVERIGNPPTLAPKKSAEPDGVSVGKMKPRRGTFSLRKTIIAFVVLFSLALASIYLYVSKLNPSSPTTLCLATDLPMNGPVGPIGRNIQNGVELARMQSSLSTTYHGYDLKKFYMDNSSPQEGRRPDSTTGVRNIQNLFQQTACPNPIAIIGPGDSPVAVAEIPLVARSHILLLSPSEAAPCLTQRNFSDPGICSYDSMHPQGFSNTFARLPGADTVQGYVIADFLLTPPNSEKPGQGGLGAKKIAIVGDEEIYGTQVSRAVLQELGNNGVKPIGVDCVKLAEEYSKDPSCSLNPGIDAFSIDNVAALAAKIRDEQPDAVFFGGRSDRGAGLLRKQLGELGLGQIPFVGSCAVVTNKNAFFGTMGSHAGNVYATLPTVDPTTFTSETSAAFSKEYQKVFGKPPGIYSANGYDAANIILQVIKALIDAGKPVTRESVVQAVLSGNFTGVAGNNIHFDQNGDNIGQRVYTIYQNELQPQGTWDFSVLAQRVV